MTRVSFFRKVRQADAQVRLGDGGGVAWSVECLAAAEEADAAIRDWGWSAGDLRALPSWCAGLGVVGVPVFCENLQIVALSVRLVGKYSGSGILHCDLSSLEMLILVLKCNFRVGGQ